MNPNEDSELAVLLEAGQKGDRSAYADFLTRVADKLRRFARTRVPTWQDPEDVVQETLIAIHRARHTFLPGRPIGPWIYAICENRIIDAHRKRQRDERDRAVIAAQSVEFFTRQPDRSLEDTARYERVRDLLDRLPEKQRRVIQLLKLDDLTVAKVSSLTGMSESAVKVSAFRGYQQIRKMLGLDKK